MTSVVALKWVDFAVFRLQQLVDNAEPNLPFGGSQASDDIVGESSDGSNAKAVGWAGLTVHELAEAAPGQPTAGLGSSADETHIVGFYFNVAFGVDSPAVWTSSGAAVTILPPFAGFDFAIGPGSVAFPGGSHNLVLISADGAKVAGTSATSLGANRATLWTNGVPALLPFAAGLATGSIANAMDTAGATVLGSVWASDINGEVACFWNGGTCYPLVGLSGDTDSPSEAWACLNGTSASGGTIYGLSTVAGPNHGWRYWDSLTSTTTIGGVLYYGAAHLLQSLPGGTPGTVNGVAGALIGGKPVAVGQAEDAMGNPRAVRWDGVTITNLGTLPGGGESAATDISDNGIVVCGWAFDAAFVQWPVWWDNANVIHKLPTLADPADFFQGEALGVSPDGTLIWGDGPASEAPPPPPEGIVRRFLICGPDWTLASPIVEMWGFDHLAGQVVYGLADGVPVGPILVDPDGHVTLPFAASKVTLGLSFMPQVQTTYLDAGAPTIQGRRKDITAVTVRVEASQGVLVGTNQPDGTALVPPQIAPAWTGMQPDPVNTDTLTSPSYRSVSGQTVQQLVTGDLRALVLTTWSTPGQVAIQGSPGLPLNVLAVIPELLEGDLTEATYAREEGGRKEPRGPGLWMLK